MTKLYKKAIGLLLLNAAIVLPTGCAKNVTDIQEENGEPLKIELITKGAVSDYTDITFRACIYDETEHLFQRTGTYCNPSTYSWLTPCSVDENGVYTATDAASGLFALDGIYDIVLYSPGIPSEDGTYDLILQSRDPGSEPLVSFSAPARVKVQQNYMGNAISYPLNMELMDRRARLNVTITCGTDIGQVTIRQSSGLTNVIDRAYYRPIFQDYSIEDIEDPTADIPFASADAQLKNPSDGTYPESFQALTDCYILSMDYSAQEGEYLYPVPYIDIYINDIADVIRIPVDIKFKPHYSYTYNVTINSFFAIVNVSLMNWDTPTEIDGDISDNGDFEFTVPYGEWEDGSGGNAEIN